MKALVQWFVCRRQRGNHLMLLTSEILPQDNYIVLVTYPRLVHLEVFQCSGIVPFFLDWLWKRSSLKLLCPSHQCIIMKSGFSLQFMGLALNLVGAYLTSKKQLKIGTNLGAMYRTLSFLMRQLASWDLLSFHLKVERIPGVTCNKIHCWNNLTGFSHQLIGPLHILTEQCTL